MTYWRILKLLPLQEKWKKSITKIQRVKSFHYHLEFEIRKILKTPGWNHEQTLHEKRPTIELQKYHCRSEGKQIRDSSLTKDIVSFQLSSSPIGRKSEDGFWPNTFRKICRPTPAWRNNGWKKEFSQISSSETPENKLSRKKSSEMKKFSLT